VNGGPERVKREERSSRRRLGSSGNELPAPREEGSAGDSDGVEGNEIPDRDPLDQRVAHIATSQNGSITNEQLARVGLRHSAIGRRSENGTLHRVFRGVYLVGHEALAPFARETAALLVAGDDAVLSHCSAAFLWGIVAPPPPDAEVHLTVIGRKIRSRPGLTAHRSDTLQPHDVRHAHTLPVTSPAWTLFDLAASNHPDLERAFAEAHGRRLVTPNDVTHAINRAGSRPGVRALRALIDDNASGFTRSHAERLLRKLIRDARIPEPRFNVRFRQYELDACWPEQRLVVEVDGFGFHGHRAQFERDRRKDMELTAAGYRVIRVTWNQLKHEPFAVVAVIVAALSLSRGPG
jgi:very-short-patch-repair endonuclease